MQIALSAQAFPILSEMSYNALNTNCNLNELCQPYTEFARNVRLRSVGTMGGWETGGGLVLVLLEERFRWGSMRQNGQYPTRTSTRPPHLPNPAHCPYRTANADYDIRNQYHQT